MNEVVVRSSGRVLETIDNGRIIPTWIKNENIRTFTQSYANITW